MIEGIKKPDGTEISAAGAFRCCLASAMEKATNDSEIGATFETDCCHEIFQLEPDRVWRIQLE